MLKTRKSTTSTFMSRSESPLRESGSMLKRQRKTLPKKTNNAEVVGDPSHDDSEGTTRCIDRRFDLGTRKLPQVLLKYTTAKTAQSRTTTSTKLRIKELKYGCQLMAQSYGTIRPIDQT